MKDFSTIACPLNELTKKNVPFVWGKAQQKAFDELKKRLTEDPLLVLPNFSKTFEIEFDASGLGIGGVLVQDGKPVAYYSEKLDGVHLTTLYMTMNSMHWFVFLKFGNTTFGQKNLLFIPIMSL